MRTIGTWRAARLGATLLMGGLIGGLTGGLAQETVAPARALETVAPARDLFVAPSKSAIIDSPVDIERVLVADGDIAEAVAVSPREVVVNGKKSGATTLIVWQRQGKRLLFDLTVPPSTELLDAVNRELHQELAGQEVSMAVEGKDVFLRGTAKNLASAQRAEAIAGTLGKVVDLLRVPVPPAEEQILLKVRFASVDRSVLTQLGVNLFSTGAGNTIGATTTGQFPGAGISSTSSGNGPALTLADALNIFLFRTDLNLGATIQALQNRNLVEILAEPNVLAINGKAASFLAGGEFPYPTLQGGGAGVGQITIEFREFGVRLTFLPIITPRGTIRLQVAPEVSSLDTANGLTLQGATIPGLDVRKVQTELELENGQSFVISGLLNNSITQQLSKVPGLGDIPLLGKLFQSKSLQKNNSELLVLVTPELVRPIPAGEAVPEIGFPRDDFLITNQAPRTPGLAVTGPVPVNPPANTIGVEQLLQSQEKLSAPGIFRNAPVAQPPTASPGGFAPFSTGASGGGNASAPATGAR